MKKLDSIFKAQKLFFHKNLLHTRVKDRVNKIKSIKNWILKNEDLIYSSCVRDYKKPLTEFNSTELNTVLQHIKFTLANINKWTSGKSVWAPIQLIGTRSKIYQEPKGVCLIISPWNYPFNLTLNPVISAIAAGNCVTVKPSEFTPHTSALILKMLSSLFSENEVAVIEGGADIGNYLINLKYDHIFFTGSPDVGKLVMRAASKNLSSVTLELGGRNHAVLGKSANIKDAVEKIMWSKFVNCGQTCIAVNHVFVHIDQYEQFILHAKIVLDNFFKNKSDFGEIVNCNHMDRLQKILNDAIDYGANIEIQSSNGANNKSVPLTILNNVSLDNPILHNEIFGPILPIIIYNDFNSVIEFINQHDKPLALYLFSKSKKEINYFLNSTSSGTVAINECMLQYANPYLPFGGVNSSGLGKNGGKYGFLEFSNAKSVLIQMSGFSIAKLIYPPYSSLKQKITKILR